MKRIALTLVALVSLALGAPITAAVATPRTPFTVVDAAATPKGWVPVAYGYAQISVPPDFPVVYPGQSFPCTGASASGPGGLLVGAAPGFGIDCVVERHPTMVYWVTVHNPSSVDFVPVQKKPIVVNGVLVYGVVPTASNVGYYAPSLGVELTARGPLARRIVNTLTRSPRTVALAPGPAPAVLPSWQKLSFQSLTFAAPAKWPVEYTLSDYPFGWICGGGTLNHLTFPVVNLSSDESLATRCWREQSQQSIPQTPQYGLQIDTGPRTLSLDPVKPSFSKHCLSIHGLTVCPATSPAYSVLVLKVTVPGRSKPVFVSIGLAGNGMVARTILYSLRPATAQGRSSTVTMPSLVYMTEQKALQKLESLGLFATVSTVATPIKPGVVVAQSPVAGRRVVRGTTVILKVSRAKRSVAGATESHWWVTLAFANSRLGIVAEGSGVEQAAHCDLSVYATSDGGASWAAPVLLTKRASCQAGGSTDQMAITTDGRWFLATPQGLFQGQVNRRGSELVQASHFDPSATA
jgi:hypothetical protein